MHLQGKEKIRKHANTHRQRHTLFAEKYYWKVNLRIPSTSFKLSCKEMHEKRLYTFRVAIKNEFLALSVK